VSKPEQPHFGAGYWFAVVAAALSGAMVALQTRINGELGQLLEDGVLAALISFGSGWFLIAAFVLLVPRARLGLKLVWGQVRTKRIPFWMLLGGVGGAFLVMAQGLTAGIIGVALFTVSVAAGQTLGALLIDTRGLIGMTKTPLKPIRVVGAVLAVLGATLASGAALSLDSFQPLLLLPLASGFAIGWQQAINGQVRLIAESAIAATFINFTAGTLALGLAKLATVPSIGWPEALPANPWLYLGGAIGVGFIAIQAITVTRIGVLVLAISLVTGQLLGSLIVDWVYPLATVEFTAVKILGVIATLIGAVLVTLGKARRN
jgi:bacterial/archaeal transporter family-2 protein